MKTLHLTIFILIFIILEPLSFVRGDILEVQNMNVYTNKDSYGKGEVIRISGEIQSANGMTVSKDIPVTIVLTNNGLQKTIETLKTYPSIDGNFAVAGISTTDSGWESSGMYTVTVSYGTIANSTTTFSFEMGDRNLLAPLKQSKLGVPSDKIECRSDLQLIIKSEDNSAACVMQQTAQTLVKRDWARTSSRESPIGITGLNSEYSVGQPINATVNYTGYINGGPGGFYPDVKILNAYNGSKIWVNCPIPYYSSAANVDKGRFGTFAYHVGCSTQNPNINETGIYIMIASFDNNIVKARFTVVKPLPLPDSFEPCDTPYHQSNNGIAVLYMPTNSIGKVCVNYSNGNDPTTVTPRVFDAQNLSHDTQDISVSPLQANVVHGNSTIVYTITSGNKAGFYGLTIFCYGTPIAVGYDNQSRIITGDFPWLHKTFYCPLQSYNYHIVGVGGGMGIKYVPP